jgi:hypothetical protein
MKKSVFGIDPRRLRWSGVARRPGFASPFKNPEWDGLNSNKGKK